jgi:hypothetical protein
MLTVGSKANKPCQAINRLTTVESKANKPCQAINRLTTVLVLAYISFYKKIFQFFIKLINT